MLYSKRDTARYDSHDTSCLSCRDEMSQRVEFGFIRPMCNQSRAMSSIFFALMRDLCLTPPGPNPIFHATADWKPCMSLSFSLSNQSMRQLAISGVFSVNFRETFFCSGLLTMGNSLSQVAIRLSRFACFANSWFLSTPSKRRTDGRTVCSSVRPSLRWSLTQSSNKQRQ